VAEKIKPITKINILANFGPEPLSVSLPRRWATAALPLHLFG
jgi:hypothetical protein